MPSLDAIEEVVRMQVYVSAFHIIHGGPIPANDDVNIKRIIYSLWGPEWNNLTIEEQRANESIIRKTYEDMHETYQPCLQEHLDETKQLLKQHNALLSGLVFKPDNAFNAQALQSVSENEADKRDREAREILRSKYDTYKQGLPHVIKRRGAGKVSIVPRLDVKNITPNDKGKKQCDVCGKWLTPNALQRHHQQVHAQDVRYAIYCPEKNCDYVDWRGDSTIDDHLLNKHKQVLRKRNEADTFKTNGTAKKKTKNKATASVSSEDPGREDDQAGQVEEFQGGDGGEAMGNEMVDAEMFDSEIIDEDMAEDSMFVDDTFDEDMNDLDF